MVVTKTKRILKKTANKRNLQNNPSFWRRPSVTSSQVRATKIIANLEANRFGKSPHRQETSAPFAPSRSPRVGVSEDTSRIFTTKVRREPKGLERQKEPIREREEQKKPKEPRKERTVPKHPKLQKDFSHNERFAKTIGEMRII